MEVTPQEYKRRAILLGLTLASGVAATGANAASKCAGERIEVYPSGDKWRWRLYAKNGQQIAEHSEPYGSKQKCVEGIESARAAIQSAPIKVLGQDCEK